METFPPVWYLVFMQNLLYKKSLILDFSVTYQDLEQETPVTVITIGKYDHKLYIR